MHIKILLAIAAFGATLAPLNTQAQIQFTSVDDAWAYAVKNTPSLERNQVYLEIAQHQVTQAQSIYLPQIKAFGNFDNYFSLPVQLIPAEFIGGPAGEFREVQFGTQYQVTYGVEASLALLSLQGWQKNKIARESAQSVEYKNQSQKLKLKEEITKAYYYSILSKEAAVIAAENYKNNESIWKSAQSKAKNGLIEPLEYNRIHGLYLESQQLYKDSELVYLKNIMGLKILCGMGMQEELTLQNIEFNVVEAKTDIDQPLAIQPETFYYQSKVAQAEMELKQQRLRYLPEVFAFARYSQNAQRNELNFANNQYPWFTIGVVGLKTEWVLFSGFGRNSSMRIQTNQLQIANLELKEHQQRETKEWIELRTNYTHSKEAWNQIKEYNQLYKDNYQIATYKFNEGIYNTDQLLSIYSELLRSQQHYLSKLADYSIYTALLLIKTEYSTYENAVFN